MAEPVEPPTTLSEQSTAAMEAFNSGKVTLADLCAQGTAKYARKLYEEATDLYAQASELQAELNGEMSSENAEILFLYGRSLFKVGQSKSDVLGGRASGEKKKSNGSARPKTIASQTQDPKTESEKIIEEGVAIVAEKNGASTKSEETGKKPLFQFTGDENFEDDSDDGDDAGEGVEGEEEDDDDLAAAFEVLDLARVLYKKKMEEPDAIEGKGKSTEDTSMMKHIKERLSDTHDLLAEISLENERFPEAVEDFRSALICKNDLYPEESELIAEAHFKLSLALEFASITRTKEDAEGKDEATEEEAHVDQAMRDEAATELELAIKSTKLKLNIKEVELASSHSPDDNDITRAQIAEVKEIVSDMENRLVELRGPALDVKDALFGPAGAAAVNPMGGILGTTLGETPAEQTARIEEAKKTATDLSGLIRKKDKKATDAAALETTSTNGNGKRKADDDPEDSDHKRAKTEESTNGEAKQAKAEDDA